MKQQLASAWQYQWRKRRAWQRMAAISMGAYLVNARHQRSSSSSMA